MRERLAPQEKDQLFHGELTPRIRDGEGCQLAGWTAESAASRDRDELPTVLAERALAGDGCGCFRTISDRKAGKRRALRFASGSRGSGFRSKDRELPTCAVIAFDQGVGGGYALHFEVS